MAYLRHFRRRTPVQTRIRTQNLVATLHYLEHVHIAQIWTRIPTPYFCVGQESESESVDSETFQIRISLCIRHAIWLVSEGLLSPST